MKYSFPTGNIYISIFIVAIGIYRLIQGRISIGDGDVNDSGQFRWISGGRARIWALVLIALGFIAGYDLLTFVGCFFLAAVIFNLTNRE